MPERHERGLSEMPEGGQERIDKQVATVVEFSPNAVGNSAQSYRCLRHCSGQHESDKRAWSLPKDLIQLSKTEELIC